MSAESSISPGRRASVWVAFLFAIAGALILGASWNKVVDRSLHNRPAIASIRVEPRLTKANYSKIKPGVDIEEVKQFLGPGKTVEETTTVINAAGQFKKHTWTNNSHRTEGGALRNHDGKPSEETGKEIEWREGDRLIAVTFINDKVDSKYSKGL
jgi:hypothetical protein